MTAIDIKVMTVSPDLAERWLKRHKALVDLDPTKRDRLVRPSKVAEYARDMEAERWDVNGETLKMSSEGRILDGHHRLHACLKAKTAFRTGVVTNVPDEAFKSIDIGKVRSAGDLYQIAGVDNGG